MSVLDKFITTYIGYPERCHDPEFTTGRGGGMGPPLRGTIPPPGHDVDRTNKCKISEFTKEIQEQYMVLQMLIWE